MNGFPAFLRLQGQPVLVVGGGDAAVAKSRLLLAAGADVTVIATAPAAELLDWAAAGRLTIERRRAVPEAVDGRILVIVADPDADGLAVAAAARAARIPVNVVDRPELCSFIMPAIIDRDPVLIAVSTGGSSPALARRVRAWIEALLPTRLGALARALDEARATVNAAIVSAPVRRRFWDSVLDGPIATRILRGDEGGCSQVLARLAAQDRGRPGSVAYGGVVHIVGAGPGDPDLLTLKALRLLQQADVVIHDRLVGPAVLDHARRDATRIAVGKAKGAHSWSQAEINALLVHRAREGQRVVRLKGGDPNIFGRVGEEVEHLRAHGIEVEVVPGITAATAAASAAGFPLSHRGIAASVTYVTGHGADDAEPDVDWAAAARPGQTLAIYMGLSKLPEIAERLAANGLEPATPAAIVENASLPGERRFLATLGTLVGIAQEQRLRGPALVIVGEVVRLADADARPLSLSIAS